VRAAITCNKNGIRSIRKAVRHVGLRLGTPAATTRGLASPNQAGRRMIAEVLNAVAQSQDGMAPMVEAAIRNG